MAINVSGLFPCCVCTRDFQFTVEPDLQIYCKWLFEIEYQ